MSNLHPVFSDILNHVHAYRPMPCSATVAERQHDRVPTLREIARSKDLEREQEAFIERERVSFLACTPALEMLEWTEDQGTESLDAVFGAILADDLETAKKLVKGIRGEAADRHTKHLTRRYL